MTINLSLNELQILDNVLEQAMDKYKYNKSNQEYTELEDLSYKISQAIDIIESEK